MPSGAISLAFVQSIKVVFSPIYGPAATREFITRISGTKAKASNPKCEVDIKTVPIDLNKETPPKIDITYKDGTETSIIPEKGTKIEHIVGQIMEQSEKLKLQEEMNEMYANPVTGPIPTKIWKGRRFWFADFEEEKSSRAAGGIKTKK